MHAIKSYFPVINDTHFKAMIILIFSFCYLFPLLSGCCYFLLRRYICDCVSSKQSLICHLREFVVGVAAFCIHSIQVRFDMVGNFR